MQRRDVAMAGAAAGFLEPSHELVKDVWAAQPDQFTISALTGDLACACVAMS